LIYIFAVFSGNLDWDALLPFLGEGIRPVLEAVPEHIGFPYGEMVLFLVLFHLVEKQQLLRKTVFLAVGLSTALLIISLLVMMTILGLCLSPRFIVDSHFYKEKEIVLEMKGVLLCQTFRQ
jgi:spore germination protein KB